MSGNAPVPPPPPHSDPAQEPAAVHPGAQQPAYHPPAYQQPAYQPPPAFTPGSAQQHAAQPSQHAAQQYQPGYAPQQQHQPGYAAQPPAPAPGGGSSDRPGTKRRGMSPGWIAFIALDVVLVGIVIAFAINLASGNDGSSTAQSPGTVAEAPGAQATPEAPADGPGPVPVSGESVASPSKNITCTIGDEGVSCGIAELASQPAPVDGCRGTVGYVVTLTDDGVDIPCVPAAAQPRAAAPDVPVLEYEQSTTVGSYTCESSTTGMRCTDSDTGKGFNVAKAGVASF